MDQLDKAIFNINQNICKNIKEVEGRGFLSQNILGQLRNFVEHISLKLYCYDNQKSMEVSYENFKIGNNHVSRFSKYAFLREFHELLQISASHYTLDENCSERLMLKYYEFLIRIKELLKGKIEFEILSNLNDFPIYQDTQLTKYYKAISDAINNPNLKFDRVAYRDRYYIHKVKPFFIDDKIYYEVTYFVANDHTSKNNRIIGFTDQPIISNYSSLLWVKKVFINIFGEQMPIFIIDKWEVSIRPCEFNKLRDIFKLDFPDIQTSSPEYRNLMIFIKQFRMNLVRLIELEDSMYKSAKKMILQNSKTEKIFLILDLARDLINKNKDGSRVVRYLLFTMSNQILKEQYDDELVNGNPKLSHLRLAWQCIPFDQIPFDSGLKNHNPRLTDLLSCIPSKDREDELFARQIKNNSEIKGKLFTPLEEITNFDDVPSLIQKYNSKLYYRHIARKLNLLYGKYVYIDGYKEDVVYIIKELKKMSLVGIRGYSQSVQSWLQSSPRGIDDEIKTNCLKSMFENSKVALIYGAAGTGKTTLVNYISNYFSSSNKLFLANTNTAVDNLRRKVNAPNSQFSTIAKLKTCTQTCDILVIDESSTVSNSDFRDILSNIQFDFLIAVGDTYQIESIRFGNWFDIAKEYLKSSSYELKTTYRTENDSELKKVWDKIRENESDILEYLSRNNYSKSLSPELFAPSMKNEVILCLNYDGVYGINNINTLMQAHNPSKSIQWGTSEYKIGDPILFVDSPRFSPLIYNNVKGIIHRIEVDRTGSMITFDIKLLDLSLTDYDLRLYPSLELLGNDDEGRSIIRFSVNKHKSTDYDLNDLTSVVPFQIAYAISIHKAQGLEYDSVKIVISKEVEEDISHSIFYTAVTRTKSKLAIYWSPESEKYILENLKHRNNARDIALLQKLL